ncbi:MAG: ABC transporter ATP-binding protein [Clostridia bacterium]|nr:ABC transporter ATP-binding protein [Clostridia bacterium]
MEAIKTAKLTKYYGSARGIIDLDLTVEQGDYYGFIGPNGAGKSTTIRTLLGLIMPTSGSASVLGRDIVKDRNEVLRRVGYLPSEAVFYEGMRVKEVLRLSAELRRKNCEAEAGRLCERLRLDPDQKVDELSFGNRKKVGIVCALQHEPELLILDEPTGGLDPLMQKEFFDILRERNVAGATVFLSSHMLHEVQRNCRRAAVIREGRIIADGSVEELARSNARRVTVRGSIDLEGLDGIRDLKDADGTLTFLYSGDIGLLLSRLAAGNVADLNVTEPELDEIFMHFYEKAGEGV